MNRIIEWIICLFLIVAIPSGLSAQHLLLQDANVIDTKTGDIRYTQDVLIEDGNIVQIGKDISNVPKSVKRVNAKDNYLIPGLWDMHVHLSMLRESSFPLFISQGVTGVRDMGGNYEALKTWRRKSHQPDSQWPYIITPGPILESPRFVAMLNQLLGSDFSQTRLPVSNAQQAKNLVDSLHSEGVDFIKIRTAASEEVFEAISKACEEKGIAFTGHIDPKVGIKGAVEAGIVSIEHADFLQLLSMDDKARESALESISENKPFFTPTLTALKYGRLTPKSETKKFIADSASQHYPKRQYLSPRLLEQWNIELTLAAFESPMNWDSLAPTFMKFSKDIIKQDIALLAGTDAGVQRVLPGWSLHEELQLMVEKLGISPLQALRSATLHPAEVLGLVSTYGNVTEGRRADLVLLSSNPLENISNTQDITAVIKNGQFIDRDDREKLLQSTKTAVERSKNEFQPERLNHLKKVLKAMSEK